MKEDLDYIDVSIDAQISVIECKIVMAWNDRDKVVLQTILAKLKKEKEE